MLAQHEQYNIAQPFFASFKPPILALLQTTLGLIDFDGDPLKIDQSVKVRFQDIVDIRQIWNVGKADQRWKFVTETLFPRWWQADRNFNETHRRLERLAVQAKSPNLSAFGGNMLKWVTNGVSTVAKWLQDAPKRLAGSTEKMIRAQSESKEKKGFKDIIKDGLIFFFLTVLPLIFIVLIAQLVLRAPGLVIVFLLLHGNRLREWWNNQPKQARLQKLRLTLSVAIGAVLLVIGCQLSSRLGPGIIDFLQPIWPTPNVWPRSAFVVPQEVVRAKVGQKLHLNSYHMSIEELDVIEILVNGHQLGGEISAVAGQAIFSNYLASIQVRSKVRPVLTNTIRLSYLSRAWAVTIQWEGHVPGVYELKLVATDVAGHQGQPLVQRIEVRE